MINLRGEHPFASGSKRLCYLYPRDPSRCIKVLRPDALPALQRRRAKKIYKRFRSTKYFDENTRELLTYLRLKKKIGADLWRHFPYFFGTVKTDMGIGLVTEMIQQDNGSISPTLAQLRGSQRDSEVQTAIIELYRFLRGKAIPVRDLNPANLLLRFHEKTSRLYIVDGFANTDFIPLADFIPWLARKKIKRKLQLYYPEITLPDV